MNRALLFLSLLAFSAIVMMSFLVSPIEAGPLGIFGFFVLCYVFFLGLAVQLCRLFFYLTTKKHEGFREAIEKKSYRYGLVVAIAPELAIILKSGGSLGVAQVVLILVFEVVAIFFMTHSRI